MKFRECEAVYSRERTLPTALALVGKILEGRGYRLEARGYEQTGGTNVAKTVCDEANRDRKGSVSFAGYALFSRQDPQQPHHVDYVLLASMQIGCIGSGESLEACRIFCVPVESGRRTGTPIVSIPLKLFLDRVPEIGTESVEGFIAGLARKIPLTVGRQPAATLA